MCRYLIVGDVDHIQNYVFGSSRLRAIRGASALLDRAAEKIKNNPPPPLSRDDIRRWRGGQIVAVLQDATEEQADNVCASMEKIFRDESAGEATITTAYEPYQDDFKKSIKAAFIKVRTEKDGRRTFGSDGEAFLTSSYDRRCDLLPSQSATDRESVGEPGEKKFRYLSDSALVRWNAVLSTMPFDGDLQPKLLWAGISPIGKLPYKPEDLWGKKAEGQYMAFVMADGNAFGQMLETIDEPEVYQKFSEELYNLTLTAIAQAAKNAGIERFSKRNEGQLVWLLPFIPIILAGDDLSVLVRAEHAVAFAYHLCNSFWELSGDEEHYPHVRRVIYDFRDKKPEAGKRWFPGEDKTLWRLTLSAGVAIAKKTFPISAFRRFASELRSSAKSRLRSNPEAVSEGGMIDFAIITTATVQPLADIRRHYRFDETPEKPESGSKEWTVLTGRPYTVKKFGKLWGLAKALKQIPRSKRKFLYREFFKGRAGTTEAYQFIMSKEKDNEKDIIPFLKELGCERAKAQDPFRDMDKEQGVNTPLLDALELAELEREE